MDSTGDYVQVAGGGATCMLERFDKRCNIRYRGFHAKPSPVFPDGTILAFGGGHLRMNSDEWFLISQVEEVFFCFRHSIEYPQDIFWRQAP